MKLILKDGTEFDVEYIDATIENLNSTQRTCNVVIIPGTDPAGTQQRIIDTFTDENISSCIFVGDMRYEFHFQQILAVSIYKDINSEKITCRVGLKY